MKESFREWMDRIFPPERFPDLDRTLPPPRELLELLAPEDDDEWWETCD